MTQIYATTERDGSAIMTIDGTRRKVIGDNLDDARRKVLDIVREHAAATETVAAFTSNDPDGTWSMLVHPDGHVQESSTPATVDEAPPHDDVADVFDTRDSAADHEPIHHAKAEFIPPALLKPPATDTAMDSEPFTIAPTKAASSISDSTVEDDPFFELERTMIRPRKAAPHGPELHFSTGLTVTIDQDVVIGRHPHLPEEGITRPVQIDADREISRTHVAFGRTSDGEVWVMDCGSSNGTWVLDADGGRLAELEPHVRYRLRPPDRLEIGNVQITLHPSPGAEQLRDLPTTQPTDETRF